MTLDELKRRLEPLVSIDVEIAYKAWKRKDSSESTDHFLIFLRDGGYLSPEAFIDLHMVDSAVEVPAVDLTLHSATKQADIGAAAKADASQREKPPAEQQIAILHDAPPKFTLLGVVGEGGMGCVHVAKDFALGRKVALKRLKPSAADLPDVIQRFVREAQITAQLDHPNIVPIYGLEAADGDQIAYAMKLVQGKTLTQLISETKDLYARSAPINDAHSLETRLEHFLKLCDAMAFAHSKGVIHRDLKPENIMLGRFNELYVMDWGLARVIGERARERIERPALPSDGGARGPVDETMTAFDRTTAGEILGTPRYMSPEQATGISDTLDFRSDLYTMGLILFELVSLRKATPGSSALDVLRSASRGNKVPLVHLSPAVSIPEDLKAIIEKATSLLLTDRYASSRALADDVHRYLRGEAVMARPDTRLRRLARAMGRHRQAVVFAAALAALGSAGASAGLILYNRSVAAAEGEAAAEAERAKAEGESQFVLNVARQSHQLDARLLKLEAVVEGLSLAAGQALTSGVESAEPLYFEEDFATPGRQPPRLIESELYGGHASLETPVWALAPGVAKDAVLPKIKRLHALRGALRQSCLSEDGARPNGAPIQRCFIGLPEGAVALFPGTDRVPEGYDPRTRPWYTLSAQKRGVLWGNPYIDKIRGQRVLPCSTSVYDGQGGFLGVVGIAVTFEYLLRALALSEAPREVDEVFLTDDQGRVIVRSRGPSGAADKGVLHGSMDLEPLPFEEVARAIREQQSGRLFIESPSGTLVAAYNRIRVLGWYHVVIARADELHGAKH